MFRTTTAHAISAVIAALAALVFLALAPATARATDDIENGALTGWWTYSGMSFADVGAKASQLNARLVSLKYDTASNSYSGAYVANTGAYAKGWWWYANIDANALTADLAANKARLISLQAYDTGAGVRFTAVMIANTGADAKGWWWYYGKSADQIGGYATANKARLTALSSYQSGGQTVYAAVMIANTGADAKGWWWYYNQNPDQISAAANTNKARIIDLTSAGGGRFNAVMEACSGGCPGWWWYYGVDSYGLLDAAQDNGARVSTLDSYGGCGGRCYIATLIADSPADVTACDAQGCISEAKLRDSICNKLAGHVVGYACDVGALPHRWGGKARSGPDGNVDMSPDLQTDIASVSKTMTAVATLQLLAANNISINTAIGPYLYSDWSRGPGVNSLTFKQLLTHSTGFAQNSAYDCGNDLDYAGLKKIIATGPLASAVGKPKYGNCNFALMREIFPALLHQPLTNLPEAARPPISATMYVNYLNGHVFHPVGVPTSSCNPPSNAVYSYPFPAGGQAGTNWGDWTLICGGGGWVLSANQIFRVISDVAADGSLLTHSQRQQMLSNCLGWDCSVRSDCPDPNACKNGDLHNGANTISVWTYAGVLKCNVPVVVVVNSQLPAPYQGGEDIIGLVKDSLAAAAVPGTPKPCPP